MPLEETVPRIMEGVITTLGPAGRYLRYQKFMGYVFRGTALVRLSSLILSPLDEKMHILSYMYKFQVIYM